MKMSNALKETTEIVDVAFDIGSQAIVSGADGFTLSDLADFFDEATDLPRAVTGLVDNFSKEVATATVSDIEILYERQREKLTRAGLHPKAAGLVVSGLKTVFYGLSIGFEQNVKPGEPVPQDPAPTPDNPDGEEPQA